MCGLLCVSEFVDLLRLLLLLLLRRLLYFLTAHVVMCAQVIVVTALRHVIRYFRHAAQQLQYITLHYSVSQQISESVSHFTLFADTLTFLNFGRNCLLRDVLGAWLAGLSKWTDSRAAFCPCHATL